MQEFFLAFSFTVGNNRYQLNYTTYLHFRFIENNVLYFVHLSHLIKITLLILVLSDYLRE